MTRRFFGTDGVRGRVGEGYITPKFVLKLGWAVGTVLKQHGGGKVLIGKDTRISGYMLESSLEAGFIAAGIDIVLVGPMPTPAVAYLTQTQRAVAGVMLSASHNPFDDNGVKFFDAAGQKFSDEMELAIETLITEPMTTEASVHLGRAERLEDAPGRYIEFCKSTFPHHLSLQGMKIVVDCANGAAYHIAPDVFYELGAEVIAIGNEPDGFNINEDCGATKPEQLAETVLATGADCGIALDGDADRLILVDAKGQIIDGDEILAILTAYELHNKHSSFGVVGTVMSNLGLEQYLNSLGVQFARANVGDRYVLEQLKQRGWTLGGEPSGHILNLNFTTTGDGIISALQVLSAMSVLQKPLHELKGTITKCPQVLLNVDVPDRDAVMQHASVQRAEAQLTKKLGNMGRILLRPSGTEPVVRVMVEANDAELANEVAHALAAEIEKVS